VHAYLLALEIEPVEVGKVYVALPLHCTVVHWFRSEKSPADILKAITQQVTATPPLELISGPADLFGKEKDVPVNRLLEDERLMEFHKSLHSTLQSIGVIDVEPMWSGDGFNMHVTRQRSGRFEEGRRFTARKLYLAEALLSDELQQKKITAKLILKGQS
jgi:2'-5' RNA ligase